MLIKVQTEVGSSHDTAFNVSGSFGNHFTRKTLFISQIKLEIKIPCCTYGMHINSVSGESRIACRNVNGQSLIVGATEE